MKFGKVFFFAIIFMFTLTHIYPQADAAKWDPAFITISHKKIIAGNTIEVSATIKVLKDVRGLQYRAGVGAIIFKKQAFPGQLTAGTTIPVKFKWKAVRGRHNLFFRLILPGKTTPLAPTRLNTTIHVIPRTTKLRPPSNLSMGTKIRPDSCSIHAKGTNDVVLESLTVNSVANNIATINVKIRHDGKRCVKALILRIQLGLNIYEEVLLKPDYFIAGSKWLIKGGKKVTWVGSVNRPKNRPPRSLVKAIIYATDADRYDAKFNTIRANDSKSKTIIW